MHQPILLLDFDGVMITQKALEYSALKLLKNEWFNWQNTENLRLIDLARMFEESDSSGVIDSLKSIYQTYRPFIPNRIKRWIFFNRFNKMYQKYEKIYDSLRSGLPERLERLKECSIPLAIISNTAQKRLEYFCDKFDLSKYFPVILSREDMGEHKKPHPYPILLALAKIKKRFGIKRIERGKVYFVGDLPSDIQSAHAAKIKSIAVLAGHGRKRDLLDSNPTYVIDKISDLSEIPPFQKFLIE